MARRTGKILKRPAALRDLIEIADFIAEATSIDAANRFLAAAEGTMVRLAGMPGIGAPWDVERPGLVGIRFLSSSRYPHHLIFYRPLNDGTEVVRVIHGARDIDSVLVEDDEDEGKPARP